MKIIIAGAGEVGTHLAKLLSGEKQDIILMDENEEKLGKLGNNFDLMAVNLSPTSISGLKEAGVAGADQRCTPPASCCGSRTKKYKHDLTAVPAFMQYGLWPCFFSAQNRGMPPSRRGICGLHSPARAPDTPYACFRGVVEKRGNGIRAVCGSGRMQFVLK